MTILIKSSRCAREDMTSARVWCPPPISSGSGSRVVSGEDTTTARMSCPPWIAKENS